MKSDTYTKAVLTIIAVCLVWLCVRDVIREPQEVAVKEWPQLEIEIKGDWLSIED